MQQQTVFTVEASLKGMKTRRRGHIEEEKANFTPLNFSTTGRMREAKRFLKRVATLISYKKGTGNSMSSQLVI